MRALATAWLGAAFGLAVILASVAPGFAAFGAEPSLPPVPLPDRPGNIHLEGDPVQIKLPAALPPEVTRWRVVDDRGTELRAGHRDAVTAGNAHGLDLGRLPVGWYRIEFDTEQRTNVAWTTAAVLSALKASAPADSPVCLDSATAWFARDDERHQRQLAALAALAGVSWVRDRLRWSELQPATDRFAPPTTTYDTAATVQHEAGLQVLQVFHDTPKWARAEEDNGGRFAADLRHVYRLGRALAGRFKGRVTAWEPWNEANVATFGGQTVDEMCSWQKAAWLGFKSGDPTLTVGWNVTAGVPTPAHTEGVLANETWPYFDTYNIHTYDWPHGYVELWKPAREAACGKPLWVTEADRGTPHLKQAPWYDQDPRLERLKAEWIAQAYASSLYAGAQRHFHFILGHYHEPNGVQFGLLRLDLTPRPAYVALAAVGRFLAGGKVLGRWRPGGDVTVAAFRAWPDGRERDVLVAWVERDVDWSERGSARADWPLPTDLRIDGVFDYLGRRVDGPVPRQLTSAPCFVTMPPGEAGRLPLEDPFRVAPPRAGEASSVVLQCRFPSGQRLRVEDLPWSEGYAYRVAADETVEFELNVYALGQLGASGSLQIERQPDDWVVSLSRRTFNVGAMERESVTGSIRVPSTAALKDGWVSIRAGGGGIGGPVVAFRVVLKAM